MLDLLDSYFFAILAGVNIELFGYIVLFFKNSKQVVKEANYMYLIFGWYGIIVPLICFFDILCWLSWYIKKFRSFSVTFIMEKPHKWTAKALFFLLKKQLFDGRKQIKIRIYSKKKDYDGHLMPYNVDWSC